MRFVEHVVAIVGKAATASHPLPPSVVRDLVNDR